MRSLLRIAPRMMVRRQDGEPQSIFELTGTEQATHMKPTQIMRTVAAIVVVLFGAAACTGTSSRVATIAEPQTLPPVANSTVTTSTLPPIGADGQITQTAALPASGDPMLAGQTNPGALPTDLGGNPGGSIQTLDPLGAPPSSTGRMIGPGFTVDNLLGVWTVISGADQCQLNLTKTAKQGTSRYRASTPGCAMPGLSVVASWQLAGSQVQLFDEAGDIVGNLLLSGDRFVGTLVGGRGVSMVG